MADRKYYVLCGSNCKFEGMTKEQIIAAIAEATGNTVTDVDAAFITKLKEQNRGDAVRLWVGTQAQYNALEKDGLLEDGVIYLTDDGSKISTLESAVNGNINAIEDINHRIGYYGATLDDHGNRITAVENKSVAVENHKHNASDITKGILGVERGGTGADTPKKARESLGIYAERIVVWFGSNHFGKYVLPANVGGGVASLVTLKNKNGTEVKLNTFEIRCNISKSLQQVEIRVDPAEIKATELEGYYAIVDIIYWVY